MKTELIRNFSETSLASIAGFDSASIFDDGNGSQNNKCAGAMQACCSGMVSKICRRKTLEKKFPIIKWLPQYNAEKLVADIVAGLTVGLTILPQALATATVGGLPPQYGLYSGFVGCFVYVLLGSTAEVTVGPTTLLAIITNTYSRGKPPAYAVFFCFITGIVTLLMGFLQIGWVENVNSFIILYPIPTGFIVNFISSPVNSGFTSASAITTCSSQLKALLGLSFVAKGFLPTVKGAIENIYKVKMWDSILSLICIIVLISLKKLQVIFGFICRRSVIIDKILWFISTARNAIVVIGCTGIAAAIGPNQPFTIIGDIAPGIPEFKPPPFSIYDPATNTTAGFLDILKEEASAIIVLPLLALMEHITIAKAWAGGKEIDASQELISIGVSNLIGCFFSSMPVSGSFSRTTVNAMSGVKSPLGGLITGSMVLLALRFLIPYFYYIPKSSLAAVIVCAVVFNIDMDIIKPMWKAKKMDFIPWAFTFIVSLLVGLEFGMIIGFVISVIYLMYYAARPGVKVRRGYTARGSEFILVDLDRSCTFPAVEYIRHVISKSATSWGKNVVPVVVDCNHIQFVDYTAAQGIKALITQFQKRDQILVLYRTKPSLVRTLTGVMPSFEHCTSEEDLEKIVDNAGKHGTAGDFQIQTSQTGTTAIPLS